MRHGPAAAIIDGLPAHQGALARVHRRGQRLLVTKAEQEEAQLDRRLLSPPAITRANTVAVMSPSGGVGKTACAFVIGSLLAAQMKLRVVAVDGNPAFGTLAQLIPDDRRSQRGLAELLGDADRLFTAAELSPYVARLPTGLHVLTARRDSDRAVRLEPDWYGELVALLSCFYEVVLLDLGPGVVGPLATFAARRADQIVLVTTPEWPAWSAAMQAVAYLRGRTTLVVNRSREMDGIPADEQFARMLETRTYSLGALASPTRTAIKRLTVAVADQLV